MKRKSIYYSYSESNNLPIKALYLINTNHQYYRYTYIIYNIYIIRITNYKRVDGKYEIWGEIGNGMLRGEGEFECFGAMCNGGLWGDGDYKGGGQRAIGD